MARTPDRIGIVLLGAIGDVVRAMPLAMRLRHAFPRARISWAVEPIAAPLLEGHPAIDERIVFRRSEGVPAFLELLRDVRARRFDWVLDLQRHLKSGIVSRASGASRRVGFHRRNAKEGNWIFNTETIPEQENFSSKLGQYLAFARHLGLAETPVEFGLASTAEERARAQEWIAPIGRPFAAAFVGSTWPSRFWQTEETAAVLARASESLGLGAVLLGGPSEVPFARAVAERAPVGTLDLVGRTALRDLIAILESAHVAFGPDSGPMHVAAAVGTPVVSLWGATSPRRSAPFGSEDLALVGGVACHPCYLRRCPVDRVCMRTIAAGDVLGGLAEGLRRRA